MEEYPIDYLARSQRVDRFVALVEQAEQGEAFTIARDGKPVAVVVGIEEYDRLTAAATMWEAR